MTSSSTTTVSKTDRISNAKSALKAATISLLLSVDAACNVTLAVQLRKERFDEALKECKEAGVPAKEVREILKSSGYSPTAISKKMNEVGLRIRGIRSDAKGKGSRGKGEDEGEGEGEGEGETKSNEVVLMEQALKLSGGDKAKAIALCESAQKLLAA
jgi:hypothetical protein